MYTINPTPRKAIGALFTSFGAAQSSYQFIKRANALLKSRGDVDIVGFYENPARPPVTPNFALLNVVDSYTFNGTLIATDLNAATRLLRAPGASRRIFYCFDIEWLRFPQRRPYEQLASIYRNPTLEVYSRNDIHAKIIADAFNIYVKVLGDWELERLV